MKEQNLFFKMGVESSVFIGKELKAERFLITSLSGHFPVLGLDAEGTLGMIVRCGDVHLGQRGYLSLTTSPDGGESWSREKPVVDKGIDLRNPAFGISSRGTWIMAFVEMDIYKNGYRDRGISNPGSMYICRSTNGGKTWSQPINLEIGKRKLPNPYGKIVEMSNGTLLLNVHFSDNVACLMRSTDDGLTWEEPIIISEGYNETALLPLDSGKLLAVLRGPGDPGRTTIAMGGSGEDLSQAVSLDGGASWTSPVKVTSCDQYPADLLLLRSGNILLTYGHRIPPYGVRAMLSRDGGTSWDYESTAILTADSSTGDCGYPSSVQLPDGRIFTAYYAYDSMGIIRYDRDSYPVGIHSAGIRYPEDIFK